MIDVAALPRFVRRNHYLMKVTRHRLLFLKSNALSLPLFGR